MITNPTQLEVSMDRLATLQRMQEAMRSHLLQSGSSLFPAVSEGYSRRIEELQYDIFEYLRERPAESPLSVRLAGPSMKPGIIRAGLVGDLISNFQSALYQVGKLVGSEVTGQEGPIKGLQSSLALNLISTAPGSFILAMDLAPRQQLNLFEEYEIASSAVDRLIGHVNELQENPEGYTGDLPTLRSLRKIASLVKKDLETIEIVHRGKDRRTEAVLDPIVRERIENLLGAPREGERIVRGKLIEINIERNNCKVHPTDHVPVDCGYDEDLEDDLISALKQDIEMAGQFVELQRPGHYKITKIERFRVLEETDPD